MTKKEFLDKLRKQLQVLAPQEIDDIIKEYEDHIDQKMKEGKTEEEAVSDFGSIEDLVKEILSAYKINDDYLKKENSMDRVLNQLADKMIDFFKNFTKVISTKRGEDVIKIVCKFILVLLLIWLLRLPCYIIEEIGKGILSIFPGVIDHILSVVWVIFVRLSYAIVAILLIFNVVNNSILKDIKEEEEEKPKKRSKKATRKEEPKEECTVTYRTLFNPLVILLKIFLIILSLPVIALVAGLAIAFGIIVCLFFQGIHLISILAIIFGLLLIAFSVLGWLFSIIGKRM